MSTERVYVVDDDASVRDAVSLLLSLHGFSCATFASAEHLLAALPPATGGCVVTDLRMGGMSGLDLQRESARRNPGLAFVFITAHGDVGAARQAFLAQAVDFLEKPFDGAQLVRAVHTALERASASGARRSGDVARLTAVPASLSPRERDVLALLVQGRDNRQIAEQLRISHRTVEVHKARVLEKCGARSVVDLIRRQTTVDEESSASS